MSERPVANLNKPPRLAACDCLNCGGGIEFDASDFAEDETRTAECPHCHKETSIFVEREKPDTPLEMTMRPSLFSDFIGQNRVKARLELAIAAAKQRGESLDHILLIGSRVQGRALSPTSSQGRWARTSKPPAARPSRRPATSPACSRISKKATFYSLTKFIGCEESLRNIFIPRWKISNSTSKLTWGQEIFRPTGRPS